MKFFRGMFYGTLLSIPAWAFVYFAVKGAEAVYTFILGGF